MRTATIKEVQAQLPELLRQLVNDHELIIVADGKPVGRLLPVAKGAPVRGRGKGKLMIHAEDNEHLRDFAEYMP